ncbi:hypothetical protein [Streptomyces turgidiscabies]|uniref:Bulb-type lectin domain-containing protein n=1 Tax=Streptomyces turgidiscabies TaxID=85558 RepID=A0ABU0RRR4_9ACTN|nr:hypothetical protein [Streptomyces turgidiscabies]MDQ0934664.1 hypothetical protein [Streptomyces turgidiscabies]
MSMIRRLVTVAAAAGLAVSALISTSGTASAAAGQSFLYRGEALHVGQMIYRFHAPQGWEIQLVMQNDGNLVEYLRFDDGSRYACWATNTWGSGDNNWAVYQRDGNFVVYNSGGGVVWASNTKGGGGSTVDMDPNGVLYVGTKAINKGC